MRGGAAARRYAKALIELARRDGMVADIGTQLQQHRTLLSTTPNLQRILDNPSIDLQVKNNILNSILDRTQPAPLLRNFLILLAEKDRLRQLEAIAVHYERMANDELRRVAQVTSAVALDAQQRQAVSQKIAAATQKDVVLETHIDPDILGGMVVRVNNVILDGSLRGQLARMQKAFIGG